jgi:hypothetical protein
MKIDMTPSHIEDLYLRADTRVADLELKRAIADHAEPALPPLVRQFDTGATRSADAGRYDPEGFLSPIVIDRFCQYMQKHRVHPDGSVRDSDNWQKGIPIVTYMKGMWRHMLHLWTRHRGFKVDDPKAARDTEEDLCAIIFNAQGMLFEMLKDQRR